MFYKKQLQAFKTILPWAIIGIGVLLRTVVFLQNRNLIIDEANIVRNIYERDFVGLFQPLNYEQFAPPIFLCIAKCELIFISAAEWSLRLFPFFCSIVNLFLFYTLLKKVNLKSGIFYPLFLFATGMIYVRYATELKQYSSDIFVSLSLLLLAIKFEINNSPRLKFFLLWLFAGSLAIWLSMPSVFVLGAIGGYYFYTVFQSKSWSKLLPFLLVVALWLAQFFAYYMLVLKPSTESEYLQNCHFEHEFVFPPKNAEDWIHNRDTLFTFFSLLGGHWLLSMVTNISFLLLGLMQLWRKNKNLFLLFGLSILFLFAAVFLRQFTLMPRVCLFIYPVLLLIIGLGLEYIFSLSKSYIFRIIITTVCIVNLSNFSKLNWITEAPNFDHTTEGFEWIEKRNQNNNPVYLHDLVNPQKIYYTEIHPNKNRRKTFTKTNIFNWQTNMDSLTKSIEGETYFMFWWGLEAEINRETESIHRDLIIKDSIIKQDFVVYKVAKK